jgi:glycosyltransferase involved in cell wall biosynthesis
MSQAPSGDKSLPVSAVIPAYNRADLLPRAIASVRAQSHPPAELIVVDDGSTDDTAAVAEAFGTRVIRHETNQGESAARNTAIEAASQQWIALLDSDDEWTPQHLEQVFALRNGHVLVADAALRRGPGPGEERVHGVEGTTSVGLDSPADMAYPLNRAPLSSVMVLRQAVLDAGGFDRSLRLCEDLDLWIRLLERGTGLISPAIGSIYNYHQGQASEDIEAMHRARRAVLARYLGRPWFSESLVRRLDGVTEWGTFRKALQQRRLITAIKALGRVFSHPDRTRGAARIEVFWARMRWRSRYVRP